MEEREEGNRERVQSWQRMAGDRKCHSESTCATFQEQWCLDNLFNMYLLLGIKVGPGHASVSNKKPWPHSHGLTCYNAVLAFLNIYSTELKMYAHRSLCISVLSVYSLQSQTGSNSHALQ